MIRLLQIALALLFVAFVVINSHPREAWQALRQVDEVMVVAAALLNIPVAMLATLRSGLIFQRLGHRIPLNVLVPTTVLGFVAGGLTPAASGELLRAGSLRDRAGVSLEDTVAVVVYERLLALYLMLVSAATLLGLHDLPLPGKILAGFGGLMLCALPWFLAVAILPRLPSRSETAPTGGPLRLVYFARGLIDQTGSLLRDAVLLARWSGVTILMFSLIAAQYWLLAASVADGISLPEAWLALAGSTLAGVLALIPLGLGVLDGTLATMLDRLGLTIEQGTIAALLVRAAVTLPLICGAFVCFAYLQRREASPRLSEPQR